MHTAAEIENLLRRYGNGLFPHSFDEYLSKMRRQFWGLRVDPPSRRNIRFFGSMTEDDERTFNGGPFRDAVAGYAVDVRSRFRTLSADADVLLIGTETLGFSGPDVEALIVHELCHWYIDSGTQGTHPVTFDSANKVQGETLYARTDPHMEPITRHDRSYCGLLCAVSALAVEVGAPFETPQHLVDAAMRFDVEGGFRP
jgi:hypothetical protein